MGGLYTVYRHTSPSGKVYVGITKCSPNKRWKNGNGYFSGFCIKFANAIRKYGWDNLKHEILLENLSKSEACYAEKYLIRWYKMHNNSYNITDGGSIGGSLVGKEHPMYGKHEDAPMYGIRGGDNPNSIKVYQYDRNGKFIKAWDSIIDAASTFDNKGSAATGITGCCKYKKPACKNYIWRYFYTEQLKEKAPVHTKKVYQYNVEGNLIGEYEKIRDVQKILNVPKERLGIISSCCRGNAISGMGYFWSYIKYDKYPLSGISPQVITKMKKYLSKKEKQISVQAKKKASK